MQNLQDIQDKIFFETKTILETLYKISSKDELLAKQDLFTEVTDRIAFLRILEKNEDQFSQILSKEKSDNLIDCNNEIISEVKEHQEFNHTKFEEETVEEEVMFTNELNDFEEEIQIEQEQSDKAFQLESAEEAKQLVLKEEVPLIVDQVEFDYTERVAKKERELAELEERRRKIVEFSKHEPPVESSVEDEEESPLEQAEKKFKLANIKGLKIVQQLFDHDTLEEEIVKESLSNDTVSLLKSHVKTDFMEAEKRKPEFKLDLNDKVAFSKSLFAGNDIELKETIEKLNSFNNIEDAKQYLSEVYYKKDWSKVDEYAQRLWNLVENKFM